METGNRRPKTGKEERLKTKESTDIGCRGRYRDRFRGRNRYRNRKFKDKGKNWNYGIMDNLFKLLDMTTIYRYLILRWSFYL